MDLLSDRMYVLFVILQVRPGPVTWPHTTPGEDVVPEQAHEVEENGEEKYQRKAQQTIQAASGDKWVHAFVCRTSS